MNLEAFDLPDDWQVKPIREAYSFTKKPRGLSVGDNSLVPFLPMDVIPIGRISVTDFEERLGSALSSGTYIENGDLLVAKITPSFENGKQAIVDWPYPFGFATTEVIALQEVRDISDKFYLFHILLHPEIRADLAGKMDGTTGRQRMSKEVFGSRLIPLPPLAEQRRIAGVLGVVQRAMEQQERLLALVAELKQTLLHQLFTAGLRGEPQKQTDLGPIPQSWEVTTLGTLCRKPTGRIQTGPFGSILHKNEYQETGTPIVNPVHLVNNRIDHSNVPRIGDAAAERLARYRLRENDLLFARRGDIGRHGIVTVAEANWFCGTGNFIVRLSDDSADSRFLNYYFALPNVVLWLERHAAGVIMLNLSNTVLDHVPVCLPSKQEQFEIVTALETLDQKEQFHARKHSALTSLFRTLLHQLMTAQLRVAVLDVESLLAPAVPEPSAAQP